MRTLGEVFPTLDLYPTGIGEVIAVATASPRARQARRWPAGRLRCRSATASAIRCRQILQRRIDKPPPQAAGADLITDDFAPADVYDVMGERVRKKK